MTDLLTTLTNFVTLIIQLGWNTSGSGSSAIQTLFGSQFYYYDPQVDSRFPLLAAVLVGTNPSQAADNINHAAAYLTSLQNTVGALAALYDLTGQSLPAAGQTATLDQCTYLINQLYAANGSHTTAYSNPATAAQNLVYGDNYLQALRQTSGALGALQDLTGDSLPQSGTLTGAQIDTLIGLLYKSDGSLEAFVSQGNYSQAAQNLVYGDKYLQALRQTSGALQALQDLTGDSLPQSGTLTGAQIDTLIGLLYNSDGTLQKFVASGSYAQAAQNLIYGDDYLQALRQTSGALSALQDLTGDILPGSGALSGQQIDILIGLLYDSNGNLQKFVTSGAFTQGAEGLVHADAYLQALRQTPGALAALEDLTGQVLPTQGPLSVDQIAFLFDQLFESDGVTKSPAYNDPVKAAEALVHGDAYLQALRNTPGALAGFKLLTGVELPASGPLTPDQVRLLMGQLFNSDGSPALAYTDPAKAAQELAQLAQTGPSHWGLLLGLALAGAAVGIAIWQGASPWLAVGIGAGIAGVTVALSLTSHSPHAKSVSDSSPPASKMADLIATTSPQAPSAPTATLQSGAVLQVRSASEITIVDPHAAILGSLAPDQAYVLAQSAVRESYAQGRWLASANDPNVSLPVAQGALSYAAAANKRVKIAAKQDASAAQGR
jgi:hypothetical protein